MNIGELRERLIAVMDLEGAFGQNMHESKEVVLRVNGEVYPVEEVVVTMRNGSFVLGLDSAEGQPEGRTSLAEHVIEMCVEAEDEMLHGSDYYDEPVVPVRALRKAMEEK